MKKKLCLKVLYNPCLNVYNYVHNLYIKFLFTELDCARDDSRKYIEIFAKKFGFVCVVTFEL